jgi:serine/threonine protein kinase
VTLYEIEAGDRVGTYRVTGAYPHSGYRAFDIDDGTRVHLDISPSDIWRDRAVQLLRAASIVGALEHPGIARIHGRGVLPDRRPWVASELAEGVPLCDVLARRELTVEEAVCLVRDLTEIAAHAHTRNIVHGAIRPHLIILRTGEKPFPIQLGGWGDLRAPGAIDALPPALTAYTAPELARGPIDGKIDVYAIGAIVHRGVTGRFPGIVTPELVPNVPTAVSTLLVRMLATDPAKRMSALEALCAATRLTGDRVLSGPRFATPRWTPAPLPDGERVANIIDLASARRDRS